MLKKARVADYGAQEETRITMEVAFDSERVSFEYRGERLVMLVSGVPMMTPPEGGFLGETAKMWLSDQGLHWGEVEDEIHEVVWNKQRLGVIKSVMK